MTLRRAHIRPPAEQGVRFADWQRFRERRIGTRGKIDPERAGSCADEHRKTMLALHHRAAKRRNARFDRRDTRARTGDVLLLSEPTRLLSISYAVFCLKKKK